MHTKNVDEFVDKKIQRKDRFYRVCVKKEWRRVEFYARIIKWSAYSCGLF